MTGSLKAYLQKDLEYIQKSMLKFESDYNLVDKQSLLNDNTFNHIGPMFLLAFARSHPKTEKPYPLATAIYFILSGHGLHQQKQNSNPLNVLWGDYFYIKFFAFLCEYDLLDWADEFSAIICQLQEAAIIKSCTDLKNLTPLKLEEVADKDYANICELCCSIAGSLKQLNDNTLTTLKRFGKNLGRSIYFTESTINYDLAMDYLLQASKDLAVLNGLEAQNIMLGLLSRFKSKISKLKIELAV